MRKLPALLAAAALVPALAITAPAAGAGKEPRVTVCHVHGDGYRPLTVNGNAVGGHEGHGDGVPGGEVPGAPGSVFDDDCVPVVADPLARAGCFLSATIYVKTDGTNPQLGVGGQPTYTDPDCTVEGSPISDLVLAFLWSEDQADADADCAAIGGASTFDLSGHPDLFACFS